MGRYRGIPALSPAGLAFWLLLAVLVIALDQATKTLAVNLLDYGSPVRATGFLNWTLLHNTGAAFSFLSDAGGWQRWFFTAVAAAISVLILVWMYRLGPGERGQKLALALILGGALGNLWDRLTLGYVVDFIQLHYRDYYWPAFNIADSAITLGAIWLIGQSLFSNREKAHD